MRSFGAEISANRAYSAELSPEVRSAILYGLEMKQSPGKLARQFGVSRLTIYRTKERFQNHKQLTSLPCSGRSRKLSRSTRRYIFLMVRRSPKMSWKALVSATCTDMGIQISKTTIGRVLRFYKVRKWKAKKRIPLSKKDAKERREFCRIWVQKRIWNDVIFSDECSVERDALKGTGYVFRFVGEGYRRDLVNVQHHGKIYKQMVWAAIWIGGRTNLIIMERDPEAPRNSYTRSSYIWALEEGLQPVYKPGILFQQDNAPIHRADEVKYWFESHGIWVMDWPPHSPDLNPIEHAWVLLKRTLYKEYPNLWLEGHREEDKETFNDALRACWDSIPQIALDDLIRSMPRRIGAVRLSKGYYTKY